MSKVENPNVICTVCSTPLTGRVRKRAKYFCSKKCAGFSHRVPRVCVVCQIPLPHNHYRIRKTCSEKCRSISRTGRKKVPPGAVLNTSQRNFRQQFIPTRGGRCQLCGYSNQKILQVHHVIPRAKGGTDELCNLLLICPNCHTEIHRDGKQIPASIQAFLKTQAGFLTVPYKLPKPKVKKERKKRSRNVISCKICGAQTSKKPRCVKCFQKSKEKIVWPTDEKLAELVWLKPALQIATELGVSSVAIKHRCNARKIETPGRGYWAKIQAGKAA